ncbi:MAG: hypothetical protein KJ970_12905 [Candidatus Eisenbacteria bacterium]|uniref:Uncharacterized protein n=1 Tax=Eiseniibacteriota bacterium TaxID=2212470 RepID=A0A948RYA5_UNCEI|nr:hypothetical protein [Candidatus Eisenbacteria bacterium]
MVDAEGLNLITEAKIGLFGPIRIREWSLGCLVSRLRMQAYTIMNWRSIGIRAMRMRV